MVLTLPTRILFLCHWHSTWEVTNFTEKRMQESILFHDNCKKPYQDHTSVSRCCGIVSKNNGTSVKLLCVILCYCNCHSNYEYDIGNCTSWTVALSFSLSYMLLYLKFPCGIIAVEVWNSTYVVMIIKCVFILKPFSVFLRHNI